MPRLSFLTAPTRIVSHLVQTKRSFGFPLFSTPAWVTPRTSLSLSSWLCLMFIFPTSFFSFLKILSFHILSYLHPFFWTRKCPLGLEISFPSKTWPQTDSIHIQGLYTPKAFFLYWGANNCLLFRTSALSEHMHRLSVIVRIINDIHLQWRPHSQWLTSSLSGDLQPSDVWQTRHPTVLPFSLCEGRVQCFLLFVFHIHVFFLRSSYCRKNPVTTGVSHLNASLCRVIEPL